MPKQYPISICMAGAVSAGAYSAGAMSELVKALRALNDESLNLPYKPPYEIVIKGMSGASAGSIQAVLSSLDLFSSNPQQELGRDAWFKATIDTLLSNDDLGADNVQSILNSQSLRANASERASTHTRAATWPAFVARDYQLRLSITNLRGIPYQLSLPEGNSVDFGMSQHNEYIQYRFTESAQKNNNAHVINPLTAVDYTTLIDGALASSAFPLAFSAVEIKRPGTDDDNQLTSKRWLDLDSAYELEQQSFKATYNTKHIQPKWNEKYGEVNTVFSVDGGATENEPLIEAFKILFGDEIDEWESVPEHVDGKVLFIDPFPNPLDKDIGSGNLRLDKSFGVLAKALIAQARFSEKLIVSTKLQNRVGLLYPKRPNLEDNQLAIKSGAIAGFSGFLKQEFMQHDYELGRLNMQRFLRYHFTIEADHPHLEGNKEYSEYWNTKGRVPIIPIYQQNENGDYEKFSQGETDESKAAFYEKGLNAFQQKFTVEDRMRLKKQLRARFRKVIPMLLESHSGKTEQRYPDIRLGFSERFKNTRFAMASSNFFMDLGTRVLAAGFFTDTIIKAIENSLDEQGNLGYRLKGKSKD